MFSLFSIVVGNLLLQNTHHQTVLTSLRKNPTNHNVCEDKVKSLFNFGLLILNPKEFLSTHSMPEYLRKTIVLSLKTKSAMPNMAGISL